MTTFSHRIIEARPAILDSEGFWKTHAYLPQAEVEKLNAQVEGGTARHIMTPLDGEPIVTFGNGFHYKVEALIRCAECKVVTFYDEAADDGSFLCRGCASDRNRV